MLRFRPRARSWGTLGLLLACSLAACNGCRNATTAPAASAAPAESPTVRLYVVSNLAGALEPCGCVKDQLGGLDHLAAWIAGQRAQAPASLLVAAGPTFFLDPKLDAERATQDRWKAEAIAGALGDLGFAGLAPGTNDWAAGADGLARLVSASKGALLASNLEGAPGAAATAMREVGGQSVGLVGVSMATAPGVNAVAPVESMKAGVAALKAKGAKILVGLAAMPRGEALRLAEAVPELHVLVVGKPSDAGDANDVPSPPKLIGSTLVVQPSNHLQTVGVVDLFVRDGTARFADASGVGDADALISLGRRIDDLTGRLSQWERAGTIPAADLEARRADLERLRAEQQRLASPPPPATGSYMRWSLQEVRESLGRDDQVRARMAEFYGRVNEHNKVAFAGRKPPPVAPGESAYVGIDVCTSCHQAERKVWDRTKHAHAYQTLVDGSKEYNLECVGCHVTGYERPGGSTVTANATLRNVQCETCHGPGEAHAKNPGKEGLVVRSPEPSLCTGACHHPPHVHTFDAVARRAEILGPGHGMADDAPWPAWAHR